MVYVTEFGKRDLIAQQLEQRYKRLNYLEVPKAAAQRQALFSSFLSCESYKQKWAESNTGNYKVGNAGAVT